jgi:hypothetical protein
MQGKVIQKETQQELGMSDERVTFDWDEVRRKINRLSNEVCLLSELALAQVAKLNDCVREGDLRAKLAKAEERAERAEQVRDAHRESQVQLSSLVLAQQKQARGLNRIAWLRRKAVKRLSMRLREARAERDEARALYTETERRLSALQLPTAVAEAEQRVAEANDARDAALNDAADLEVVVGNLKELLARALDVFGYGCQDDRDALDADIREAISGEAPEGPDGPPPPTTADLLAEDVSDESEDPK